MAKSKLGSHLLTDENLRVLVNLFSDPTVTQGFVRLLTEVSQSLTKEQATIMEAYIMNDDPVARAMALKCKGKAEFVAEMLQLVKTVTK